MPLSTLHQPGYGEDAFFTEGFEGNFVEGNGGVLGAAKGAGSDCPILLLVDPMVGYNYIINMNSEMRPQPLGPSTWLILELFGQIAWYHVAPIANLEFSGSPECFQRLMELYEKGAVPPMAPPGPDGPRVLQMGFRDGSLVHVVSCGGPCCKQIPFSIL